MFQDLWNSLKQKIGWPLLHHQFGYYLGCVNKVKIIISTLIACVHWYNMDLRWVKSCVVNIPFQVQQWVHEMKNEVKRYTVHLSNVALKWLYTHICPLFPYTCTLIPRSHWVGTYKNLNNFGQERSMGMGLVPFYSAL